MSLAGLLNRLFTVRIPTSGWSAGAISDTYANDTTGNPGRLQVASANEVNQADRDGLKITHKLFCLTDVSVKRRDKIVMETGDEGTLKVISVTQPSVPGHHKVIMLDGSQPVEP
jgi:hypothetical protein